MAWVAVAVAAVGGVMAISSADSQRKAVHAQQDAQRAAQAADAAQAAKAEAGANAALVASKQRRRGASGLLAADPAAMDIGATVLGSGAGVAAPGTARAPRTTLGGP